MQIKTCSFYRDLHPNGEERVVEALPTSHWHIIGNSDYYPKEMWGKKVSKEEKNKLFVMLNKILETAKSVFHGHELFYKPDAVYPVLTEVSVMYDGAGSVIATLENNYLDSTGAYPDLYIVYNKGAMMLSGVCPDVSAFGEFHTKLVRNELTETEKENWVWIVTQELLEKAKEYFYGLERGYSGSITVGASADNDEHPHHCLIPPTGMPLVFISN